MIGLLLRWTAQVCMLSSLRVEWVSSTWGTNKLIWYLVSLLHQKPWKSVTGWGEGRLNLLKSHYCFFQKCFRYNYFEDNHYLVAMIIFVCIFYLETHDFSHNWEREYSLGIILAWLKLLLSYGLAKLHRQIISKGPILTIWNTSVSAKCK